GKGVEPGGNLLWGSGGLGVGARALPAGAIPPGAEAIWRSSSGESTAPGLGALLMPSSSSLSSQQGNNTLTSSSPSSPGLDMIPPAPSRLTGVGGGGVGGGSSGSATAPFSSSLGFSTWGMPKP
ncbi:unnamed protein product, partial [Discosporangium mesarthrocarpum]